MAASRFILLGAILVGTGVLLALGTWQVQRLQWKEALIARVEQRRTADPASLAQIEALWHETGDVDYRPVNLSGRFDHSREQYYFNTLNGVVGWNVFTPLLLEDGRVAFVNRGFVPDERREPQTRIVGQVEGPQEVTGLARNPLQEKPNPFVPDNKPGENVFFWRSLAGMAQSAQLEPATLVPFFVDAGNAPVPGGLPIGGTTRISFPNNHLQYAITWYGLALALLGVGGYYMASTRRRSR